MLLYQGILGVLGILVILGILGISSDIGIDISLSGCSYPDIGIGIGKSIISGMVKNLGMV